MKEKKIPLKKLFHQCWDIMSYCVRFGNADAKGFVKCVTCGKKKHWKQMNAGHCIHRVLDFDEININPQCRRCNKFLHGNLETYTMYLLLTYGEQALKDLHERANIAKEKKQKYSRKELEAILLRLEKRAEFVSNGEYK